MFEADMGNAGVRWEVIRIRRGCESQVTLLSREFFGLTTHFYRVTIPCALDGCALCDVLGSRGVLYLAVMCNGRRCILELGVHSANDLEQHCKLLHGGMIPGLVLRMKRVTAKGPLHSEVVDQVPGCGQVDMRTLAQRVLAVYKLPCCNPDETIEAYACRIQKICLRRNEHIVKEMLRVPKAGV